MEPKLDSSESQELANYNKNDTATSIVHPKLYTSYTSQSSFTSQPSSWLAADAATNPDPMLQLPTTRA